MQIDNTYLTNRPLSQPEEPTGSADTPRRPTLPQALSSEESRHTPSPELLTLLARVKQAPEVRTEVLQRVARNLANGYYLTREAAERTAEVLQSESE